MSSRILGIGSYLPPKVLTNADLERLVDTSDEWIRQRTGIIKRRILEQDSDPAIMGIESAKQALKDGGISAKQLDLLIYATNFPHMISPGSAPFLAQALDLGQIPFFDLKAGCSGFVYGLVVANGLINAGAFERILLVGSEALSRVTDWKDRKTCVLFGDGAGAVIIERAPAGEGVLGISLHADGKKAHLLRLEAGGIRIPVSHETIDAGRHFFKMEGKEVFKSAVAMMEFSSREALANAGLELADVDWIIPHQANIRIMRALAQRMEIPMDQIIVNIDQVANTSTASIPLALDEAYRDGRIKRGQILVLTAFGAGVTYGAVVMKF